MTINKRELAFLHEVAEYEGAMHKHTATAKSLQAKGLICFEWHSPAADNGAWYMTPIGYSYAKAFVDAKMPTETAPEPTTEPEAKRKVGRPAKYSSNVERQAAYNQRKRDSQAQAEKERMDRVAKRKAAVRGTQMYAGSMLLDLWKSYECGDERKGYLKQIIDQLQNGRLHITIDET